MSYADGFVIAIKKKNLPAYVKMAKKAGKIWREHGALEYIECVGDDLKVEMGTPFTKLAKTTEDEVVVFSWILYKSKAHRNAVNKKVMKDPRISSMCDPNNMPFEMKRMTYGGFKAVVEA